MRELFKNKLIWSLVFSTFFVVFILPITEAFWFETTQLDQKAIIYSYVLKLLFGVSLTAVIWFFIHFAEKLLDGNVFYKNWLKGTLIYLAILLGILLLIFPGYWVWDEFFVLDQSQTYIIHSWQHIFTQIQYIFSLYLIPSSTGVTIIQLLLISVVVGYVLAFVRSVTKSRWLWLLCFVSLLSFPVLLGNFYTLRLHIYGYILLLFLCLFIKLFSQKQLGKPRYLALVGFTILLTLLAFWRSEGIVYLITLPFIAYRLGIFRFTTPAIATKSFIALGLSLLILLTGYFATSRTEEPHYKLTASINPLSMLIHDELEGADINAAWNKVDKVLNLEVLKLYPSYTEIPSVWRSQSESVFRDDYEAHLQEYYEGFSYIISHNPALFLKYKYQTFLATNSMSFDYIGSSEGWLTPYTLSNCEHLGSDYCERLNSFAANSKLNGAINAELRNRVIDSLLLSNGQAPYNNPLRIIVWNVVPVFLALLAVGIYALLRKDLLWVVVVLLLFAHSALVFIAAPANYFMYYFPVYLTGGVLSIIYMVMIVDKKIIARKK